MWSFKTAYFLDRPRRLCVIVVVSWTALFEGMLDSGHYVRFGECWATNS